MVVTLRGLSAILIIALVVSILVVSGFDIQSVSAQAQNADRFQYPLDMDIYSPNGGFEFLDATGNTFHPGLDLNRPPGPGENCDVDLGDPVYAVANGTVVAAHDYEGAWGNIVLIEHTLQGGDRVWSQYAHLDSMNVSAGNTVTIGSQVGTIGKGGWECAHLHWEMRISNLAADNWPPPASQDGYNYVYNNYVNPDDFVFYSEITSGVALFEHKFFRGSRVEIRQAGFFNVPDFFNDKASSIALPQNWTARIYKHANREGAITERKTLYGDDLDFANNSYDNGFPLNDSVSAIDVYINFCPADSIALMNAAGEIQGCQGPTPTPQPPPPASGWNQTFYSTNNLSSQCGSRNETDIYMFRDSRGGWGPPSGCPSAGSAWSVRMERSDAWFDGGNYEFGLFYDDNARLFIDDVLVVDGWNATQHYYSKDIPRGNRRLRLEYKNNAGDAIVQLWWRGPGALPSNTETQDPNQWWVNYWGNQGWWHDAVGSRNEGTGFLDHNWGSGSPGFGIPGDHFSMRFERTIYFDCGTYRFHLSSDDGSRLKIDGVVRPEFDHLVTNTWDTTANITLPSGNHTLLVDYFENGGGARVYFDWTPVSYCPPTPTPTPVVTLTPTPAPCPTITEWKGEYWNNDSLTGLPSLCRNDATIDFDWGSGSPDPVISADHFSARWTRTVHFDDGYYTFVVFHDDGFRLKLGDVVLLENWCTSGCRTTDSDEVFIPPGDYEITLEIFELGGGAAAKLTYWLSDTRGDGWEPDDTSGQANSISSGIYQIHSIIPAADEDWVTFQLNDTSAINLETRGPSTTDNTRMWLYDSNLNEIEFKDDGGVDKYSRIYRLCGINALPAGTYYAKIDEYENNDELPSYDVFFDITETCIPPSVPSNLTSSSSTQNSVTLSWEDNSNNETGFNLYRGDGQTAGLYSQLGANITTFTDTQVGCGKNYFYQVSAYNAHGESGITDWIQVDAQGCTPPQNDDFDNAIVFNAMPYTASLEVGGATQATDDPSFACLGTQRFNTVWYKYIPSVSGQLTVHTFGSNYDTVLAVWTGTRGNLESQGCHDDISIQNRQSEVKVSVIAGTTYYVEVASYHPITSGSLSISASQVNFPGAFNNASPPNGATNQPTSLTLSWGTSTGATSYEYCYDTSNDGACSAWINTGTNTNTNISGLMNATTYYWQVRAVNSAGTTYASGGSTVFWVFTTNPPTPTFTPITPTSTFTPISPTPTFTPIPPVGNNPIYLSLTTNGTVGGVAFGDEDILQFNGTSWSLFFDGSDVGLPTAADLFAFYNLDADTILMSFAANVTLGGVTYTPRDIARFDATSLGATTAGTFSMYFNGVDVGLSASAENIDALDVLSDGKVLISTTGNPTVTGVTGAADEDVLAFTPTTLGNSTSGTWALYFDGSDVGLSTTADEDIDALDVTTNGNIYLSTLGDFAVTGVSGFDEDVFLCVPTSLGSVTTCNYSSSLYFDGSTWGLSANGVDAINLISTGPPPTNTATNTPSGPTNTPTPTPTRTNTPTWTNTPPGPSSTPTLTPTATNTPSSSDLIFTDSFESGNLAAWTSSTTDVGDLGVGQAAALVGSQGMQAVIDDANTIYVTDDSPIAEMRYRARFYFDPNSIAMTNGDTHFIFKAFIGTSTEVLRVEFARNSGAYQIRASLLDDTTIWVNTSWFTISDASHSIELDWRASTGVGANNGGLTLWIDGGLQQSSTSIVDNDTRRIDRVRLGALTGVDTGTRGTYFFDAFESRRQNYIGP